VYRITWFHIYLSSHPKKIDCVGGENFVYTANTLHVCICAMCEVENLRVYRCTWFHKILTLYIYTCLLSHPALVCIFGRTGCV